jgi:endoglucanase
MHSYFLNLGRLLLIVCLVPLITSCQHPGTKKAFDVGPDSPSFSFLKAEGTRVVDEHGKPAPLKGCNLGNWLLLEMWMLTCWEVRDQHEFEAMLTDRFGPETKDRLMETYRENWITERDFEIVRSFGFNVVRVPFNYTLLEDDEHPFQLKPDAFKWLDTAIRMAAKHGLYVILDMHGVPGRQSVDHTTGRLGMNKLWYDETCLKRTVWLWERIAERYKNCPVVAAYEPINEPFGDYKTPKHLGPLVKTMEAIYRGIRAIDQRHLIVIPGAQQGVTFYGAPKDHGWENVIITEHYYPGVHWDQPSLEIHKWVFNHTFVWLDQYMAKIQAPFFLGEFNVVYRRAGGPAMMRYYFDHLSQRGWWGTLWSYKLVQPRPGVGRDNWYMVKNLSAPPLFSLKTSSEKQIESYFKWFGTMDYAVDTDLRDALTTNEPMRLILDEPAPLMAAPAQDPLQAWTATDIAAEPPGGQRVYSETKMDVYGGGRDIWNERDEFRFVHQKPVGNFTLEATITNLDEVVQYSKAGLMIRGGLEPEAPHVLLHVFPSSQVILAYRANPGVAMEEKKFQFRQFPVRLRLQRTGHQVTASYSWDGQEWFTADTMDCSWLGPDSYAGLVALSHDNRFLTCAAFEEIHLTTEQKP